jgi:hypothetical protein
MHPAQEHCHGGEFTCQARVRVFPSEQIPMFNSSAISLTPNLRSVSTKVRILSTFAYGYPLLGPPSTFLPSWTAYATQKHSFFIFTTSLALLPIFTQNSMFIRCSRFLSLISPSTVYRGHAVTAPSATWERTTHLIRSSCKRKLEHVQTCLCTWVCLTQQPSNKLSPFQELNCPTLYLYIYIYTMHYTTKEITSHLTAERFHPHLGILLCTKM